MKTKKQLQKIYDNIENKCRYTTFNYFHNQCKELLHDIKSGTIICHVTPSKSGMSRKIRFHKYNWLINALYHGKITDKSVEYLNISGCGMDMLWYSLFTSCEMIATPAEIEKYNLNSRCSSATTL